MNGAEVLAGSSGEYTGAQQRSIVQLGERYQPQFFAPPPPYVLTGPRPDKRQPDVWAVYRAAVAGKWPVYFLPGLVMQVGMARYFEPNSQCYVFFHGRYHHRFIEATFPCLLVQNLDEFVAWLQEHPYE